MNPWPIPDSDRIDLTYSLHVEITTIQHNRNGVIADREVMLEKGVWRFSWSDITQAEMELLQYYTDLDTFRFYPYGQSEKYFQVYCPASGGWSVTPLRGGNFNVTMLLKEYTLYSSSSSSQ